MAYFFRRILGNQNDNAGDEDSEDENEALLVDAGDSDSSGNVKQNLCCKYRDHVM